MKMEINFSVIISTYPAKTRELSFCLKALTLQKYNSFEVIVVNDGDDTGTEKVIKNFSGYLDLSYSSRKNDLCPSRSRNTGAKNAKNDFLVFLDSDVLPNPEALNVYSRYFENYGRDISVWGLSGHAKKKSPALYTKDIENLRPVFSDEQLRKYIEQNPGTILFPCKPYFFAYSGNFAISKENFLNSGGFNENFIKWGGEDIEFGYRLYHKKTPFYFSKEAWGEHLRHEKKGAFYEDYHNSPGLTYMKNLLEKERLQYFASNKDEVIKEWEHLLSMCNNEGFADRHFKIFRESKKTGD